MTVRIFVVISICLVAQALPTLAFSESHTGNSDAFIEIVTEDWRPYNFVQDGELMGSSVETMKQVLAHAKVDHRITVMPWARAYKTAMDTPNHMIFTMKRIPEREPFFVWGRPLVVGGSIYPYRLKKRTDVSIKSVNDLKNYNTATIRDSFEDTYLTSKGMSDTSVYVSTIPQFFRMAEKHRIDYFLLQEQTFSFEAEKAGVSANQFVNEPFEIEAPSMYFAFNPQTAADVIDRILQSFDHLKTTGQLQ